MHPKLTENKAEITLKQLENAGHALILMPFDKHLPNVPGDELLRAVLKRRDLKVDALAKTPLAVELPGGALVVYAMVKPDASVFETHEHLRKATAMLLGEHPKALSIAVFGSAAEKTKAAEAAIYVALVNAAPLPNRKSKTEAALKSIALYGMKSIDGFAVVRAVAEGNMLTRSLTVMAPDELTPAIYRKRIKALAKTYGWDVKEFSFNKLKKMGAGRVLCGGAGIACARCGDRAYQYSEDRGQKTEEGKNGGAGGQGYLLRHRRT